MMFKFKEARKQNQKHLLKYLEDGNLTAFTNLLESKDKNNIDLTTSTAIPTTRLAWL
jgi:hypothetical protein